MAIAERHAPADLALGTRAGGGLARSLGRKVGLPLGFALAAVVGWELLCRLGNISPVLLAPPSAVWQVLATNPAILLEQAIPTTLETVVGFALATVLGVVLGVAITVSARVREALYPHIVLFQLIPKIALAPLFVIWLGISSESRLAYATFISFFPVVISASVGLATTERDALRLCQALTATAWQTFVMVRFPFALPHIFSGMKIAVTMAFIGIIVGEFISAKAGLGFYILYAGSRMETAAIFAAIFVLCVIGLMLYGAVAGAERLVRRWYRGW